MNFLIAIHASKNKNLSFLYQQKVHDHNETWISVLDFKR